MATTPTGTEPRGDRRPTRTRRNAAAVIGVAAIAGVAGIGGLVGQVFAGPSQPAGAGGTSDDAYEVWTVLLGLDAHQDAVLRAGMTPELRAAVDELDRTLTDYEASLVGLPNAVAGQPPVPTCR